MGPSTTEFTRSSRCASPTSPSNASCRSLLPKGSIFHTRHVCYPVLFVLAWGSFGILCFEVATRADPFPGMKPLQVVKAVSVHARRPELPNGSSPSADVVQLMKNCWKQEPGKRPDGFGSVVETLLRVVARVGDPHENIALAARATSGNAPADIAPAKMRVLFVCYRNTCRRLGRSLYLTLRLAFLRP